MAGIYINGTSSVSALGRGADINLARFNKQNLNNTFVEELDCHYQSINSDPLDESLERIYRLLSQVIDDLIAQLSLSKTQLANTCLFLGSSSMDIGAVEIQADKKIWLSQLDKINQFIINKYGLKQLNFTFNTACTASCNALIYATRLITNNTISQALVIGCEFFNQLTVKGFKSLELISQQGLFAFSKHRNGMLLGEGVGALYLSCEITDNTKLEVLGGYSSCDTYSLTTTREDGSHIKSVIEKSLAISKVNKEDIDLIKGHGTASIASDHAEVAAMKATFDTVPPILALKPYLGHTLGACGALEIALLNDLIIKDVIPVPQYVAEQDKLLVNFVSGSASFEQFNILLLNHFGFGGNNAAIVIKNLQSNGE